MPKEKYYPSYQVGGEIEDDPSKWESILDILERVRGMAPPSPLKHIPEQYRAFRDRRERTKRMFEAPQKWDVPNARPKPLGGPPKSRTWEGIEKDLYDLENKMRERGEDPTNIYDLLDKLRESMRGHLPIPEIDTLPPHLRPRDRRHEIQYPYLKKASNGGIIGLEDGGMAPETTTVEASTVNPAVGQQYADLTDRIVQEGQRPYQQYGGQRIAGFTGPEAMAQQGIVNYGMSGGPQSTQQAGGTMGQAGRMMGSAAQGIGSLMPAYGAMSGQFGGHATGALGAAQQGATAMGTLGASMGSPAQQSSTDMGDYMSQYTKGVTDPQLAQLAEFQKMQGEELGAQATASGNLGGMREGVQSAQIARDTAQQAAGIIGKAQQDAFANAQQAFQADRAAQMAGQGQQLQAQQAAGALGQAGYGTMGALMGQQMDALGAQQRAMGQMGGIGAQMGALGTRQANLGQQQQAQQLQRLNAMQNVGAQQRALQQQSMNMGYQDWQNQQNQNRQNINWQLNAMGALPYQNIQARTDYTGVPSDLNAFLGAGVKGMTLYNQYKNGGSTGNGGQN